MGNILDLFRSLPHSFVLVVAIVCVSLLILTILASFQLRRMAGSVEMADTLEKAVAPVNAQVDMQIRLIEFNLDMVLSGPARLLLALPIIEAYRNNYDNRHPFLANWREQLQTTLTIAKAQLEGSQGQALNPVSCQEIAKAIELNKTIYFSTLHRHHEAN